MPRAILNPEIESYLRSVAGSSHPLGEEMEKLAADRNFPIVGPLVGRLLFQQAKLLGARRILELGSGYGYSAFWFAQAVGEDGTVVCTELSDENVRTGRGFLQKAGLKGRVRWHTGNALELVEQIEGPFDIIFNDVDKAQYPESFLRAEGKLRPGGLFISDNMLWFGRVTEPNPDDDTRGIQKLTQMLYSNPRYVTTIIPLRDGVSISLKLQ
jgi:predicted O-methyltransferase YrrM